MNRECILEQAKQHDSFYLYEEAIIRKNTEQLKTDFPGVTFLYSVKCNPYPEVLRCVLNQGFGVDAASIVALLRSACGSTLTSPIPPIPVSLPSSALTSSSSMIL